MMDLFGRFTLLEKLKAKPRVLEKLLDKVLIYSEVATCLASPGFITYQITTFYTGTTRAVESRASPDASHISPTPTHRR